MAPERLFGVLPVSYTHLQQRISEEEDRIRREAERRADLARESAEEDVRAAADRARQEALSAASSTAPDWERAEATEGDSESGPVPRRRRGGPGSGGYRTF